MANIIKQLEDLKEWAQNPERYERRLAFRGNLPSTEAGTIPIEWDELSDREQEYYRTGPWSTREDYSKGQLVQPGPGRQGYKGKEPSPYLKDKKFLKWADENYPGYRAKGGHGEVYAAWERNLLKKNKIIGVSGLMDVLGDNNPYSKDMITRALGPGSKRKITEDMSASTKSKIRMANKLRKIIIDNVGEPKLYSDAMKEYKNLKKEAGKYDLKPGDKQGLKKYWDLDKKKINALKKALDKNYRMSGLRENTIDNIYNFFNDEDFMKSLKKYKGGEVDLNSSLFKKVFKPGLAGERSYAYMMLGRALRGEIELEGIKKNKVLGDKIIQSMTHDKNLAKYGQMDKAALRWAKFQMAKHFDDPNATYDTITKSISKAFRDAGIYKKLGYTLVTDEIFPARTGQLTIGKGSGAYNQFVQFIDKKINAGAKRSFDGRASTRYQEIIEARKKGNWTRVNELVEAHETDIKNTYKKNPEMKGKVKLTQLNYNPKTHKFASPTKIYGKDVLPSKIQKDIDKFYRKTGLSLDVGSTMTLEKAAAEIKDFKTYYKNSRSKAAAEAQAKLFKRLGIKPPCSNLVAGGGRIGFANRVCGEALAKRKPNLFLELAGDEKYKKIIQSMDPKKVKGVAKGILKNMRKLGVANPFSWIGGEIWYVGLDAWASSARGKPLDVALDNAFIFYNADRGRKDFEKTARDMGYSESQMEILRQTLDLSANQQDIERREYHLSGFQKEYENWEKFKGTDLYTDLSGAQEKMSFDQFKNAEKQLALANEKQDNLWNEYVSNISEQSGKDPSQITQEDLDRSFTSTYKVAEANTRKDLIAQGKEVYEDKADWVHPYSSGFGEAFYNILWPGNWKKAYDMYTASPEKLEKINKERNYLTWEQLQDPNVPLSKEAMLGILGGDGSFGRTVYTDLEFLFGGASGGRVGYTGGGIATLHPRRPGALPPPSGPDSQGLAYLNNYATKRTE
jgi:hypothetical protein